MADPRWLTKAEVLDVHQRQLAEHGGPSGVRDEGLLESAVARPQNLPTVTLMFATSPPPTRSGSRRTIRSSTETSERHCTIFLLVNGYRLPVDDAVNVETWQALAAGILTEVDLAVWLRERVAPIG